MNKVKISSISLKSAIMLINIIGIAFALIKSPTVISGLLTYEVLVNICCFAFTFFALLQELNNKQQSDNFHLYRIIILIGLLVCSLCYYILIAPREYLFNFFTLHNLMLRLIAPLLFFIDYLFFDSKKQFNISQITTWLIIPILYIAVTYILAVVGFTFYVDYDILNFAKFPYFFLNVDLIGIGSVCLYVLGIGASMLCLGFLLYILDSTIKIQPAYLLATKEERKANLYIKQDSEIKINMGLPEE